MTLLTAVYLVLVFAFLAIGYAGGLPAGWEVFAAVLSLVSPILLKYAPTSWKGKPMLFAAVALSIVLGALAMYLEGDFTHFDAVKAATYLTALAGLQQIFYNLFKDNWNLSDPALLIPGQPAAVAPAAPVPPPPPPA